MDKIDSKRGWVTRQVGHMKPFMVNAAQMNTIPPIQTLRIRNQLGCWSYFRLSKRKANISITASSAAKNRNIKIIRLRDGIALLLVE